MNSETATADMLRESIDLMSMQIKDLREVMDVMMEIMKEKLNFEEGKNEHSSSTGADKCDKCQGTYKSGPYRGEKCRAKPIYKGYCGKHKSDNIMGIYLKGKGKMTPQPASQGMMLRSVAFEGNPLLKV